MVTLRAVWELALAHVNTQNRGALPAHRPGCRRRALMEQWAAFLAGPKVGDRNSLGNAARSCFVTQSAMA